MPPGPPKPTGIKLPSSPLDPLRDIIRGGRERVEKAGSDIRSLADELRSGFPDVPSTIQSIPPRKLTETPTTSATSQNEGLLPVTVPQKTLPEENTTARIATGCLPCAVGHFSTSSGLLKEAVRFKGEGMTSNEILDRIASALEEQNALEREDLSPEKIQGLPEWERPIAEEALARSRELRHKLEGIKSIEELEQIAAGTKRYYIELNRQWYRGRFSKLGTEKAEAISQRVGEE